MRLICFLLNLSFGLSFSIQLALQNTYQGIKTRNIDNYSIKCVHRPFSETPNDCVSEGIGYFMLLSVYSNDQKYFDLVWDTAEQFMWNGSGYDWRIDANGNKIAYGTATDAEQDIAVSLIFAQQLVNQDKWIRHKNLEYGERAQNIIDNMWNNRMISYGGNIAPGGGWGGDDFVNPGYFAPAWYKIFKEKMFNL